MTIGTDPEEIKDRSVQILVPGFTIYYSISRYDELPLEGVYYKYPNVLKLRDLLTDILTFYDTPLSADDIIKYKQIGSYVSVGDPRSEALGSKIYIEGFSPYEDGFELVLGS